MIASELIRTGGFLMTVGVVWYAMGLPGKYVKKIPPEFRGARRWDPVRNTVEISASILEGFRGRRRFGIPIFVTGCMLLFAGLIGLLF